MDQILEGISLVLQWENLLLAMFGVAAGMVLGCIPGLNANVGIVLLLPFTFYLGPVPGIAMLMGMSKGDGFGGSIPSILFNIPGTAHAVVTTLDGYPLTKKGQGGKALETALAASCTADFTSDLILIFLAAPVAAMALHVGPPEYTMIVLFSVVLIALAASDDPLRGLVSTGLGLLLAAVGMDPDEGTERPVQERFFKGRRVDFRKQDIELWPTECQLCGGHGLSGFRINEKAETCVPGLYAAGDVASVPQQHLSGAFVFGEIAGEQAVEFAAAHDQPAFDADAVESFLAEHERRSKMDGEIALPELEHKARRLITDYTISPKNHLKLTRWLEWSEILKDELRGNVMVRNGHDLALMYEVENIIRSADLSATAARFREESRWGSAHKRFDFPERDDVNWKCHVVLKKGADDAIVPSKVRVQNTMQEEVVL